MAKADLKQSAGRQQWQLSRDLLMGGDQLQMGQTRAEKNGAGRNTQEIPMQLGKSASRRKQHQNKLKKPAGGKSLEIVTDEFSFALCCN